jgi:hypothetical protein
MTSINEVIHTTSHNAYFSGYQSGIRGAILELEAQVRANTGYAQFGLRNEYKEQIMREVVQSLKAMEKSNYETR